MGCPNCFRQLPKIGEKTTKIQTSSCEKIEKTKLILVVSYVKMKTRGNEITEVNNKNQVVGKYV